jgi:hypothetical protein
MYKGAFFFVAPAVYTKRSFFLASAAALSEVYKSRQILCCSLRIRYDSDVGY